MPVRLESGLAVLVPELRVSYTLRCRTPVLGWTNMFIYEQVVKQELQFGYGIRQLSGPGSRLDESGRRLP